MLSPTFDPLLCLASHITHSEPIHCQIAFSIMQQCVQQQHTAAAAAAAAALPSIQWITCHNNLLHDMTASASYSAY